MAKKKINSLFSLRSEMPGIDSISQLVEANPQEMYDNLCALTGSKVDICVFDTFCCAS